MTGSNSKSKIARISNGRDYINVHDIAGAIPKINVGVSYNKQFYGFIKNKYFLRLKNL